MTGEPTRNPFARGADVSQKDERGHSLFLISWVQVRGQGDWVMDIALRASCRYQCPCPREKGKKNRKNTESYTHWRQCCYSRGTSTLGVDRVWASNVSSAPDTSIQVRRCHCELEWKRVQVSFLKSSGKPGGASLMIGEDVRHLEMPDKRVVRVAVTIGFTTKKMVRTRKRI